MTSTSIKRDPSGRLKTSISAANANIAERASSGSKKRFRPLLSMSKLPTFDISGKGNGKAKDAAKPEIISLLDENGEESEKELDDRLWVERYEPQTENELAVHKRKVEDVRRWMQEAFDGGSSGRLRRYRKILALTGLSGTAKTTTVRVLARELGFEILEWRNALDVSYGEDDYDRESLNHKFDTFLSRAAACRTLLGTCPSTSTSSSQSRSAPIPKKQVILLEDLPNILHQPTQAALHASLESFVAASSSTPLILIISDASTRAEARDERLAEGGGGQHFSRDTVDIRCILPPALLNSPFVTQIAFNPIAPTLMHRALQAMLSKHYAGSDASHQSHPSKEDLDMIVETSKGDIRNAVMALQFSCILSMPKHPKNKSVKRKEQFQGAGSRFLLEAKTQREQALALFHLIGRVLYNKRKGDPTNPNATTKERLRDRELDANLQEQPSLPFWLSAQERRTSRVDIDTLYADSPVDTGLFSLYIHQNYSQFCNEICECEELCDWLSWIDSSGGEHWYQTNPHQFHLLTMGTLHSLPSPVPRRSQKVYKPEFFDVLKKTREAEDAAEDVRSWLLETTSMKWNKAEIVKELGANLKALSKGFRGDWRPPPHASFSSIDFNTFSGGGPAPLNDRLTEPDYEEETTFTKQESTVGDMGGTWLEADDIEDF